MRDIIVLKYRLLWDLVFSLGWCVGVCARNKKKGVFFLFLFEHVHVSVSFGLGPGIVGIVASGCRMRMHCDG